VTLFKYSEPAFYLFGVRAGIANAVKNRFSLGVKKTLGKITQPVNHYSRFPEYHFFLASLAGFITQQPARLKILDVGSPKLFGLYLAHAFPVDLTMTDISPRNIDEYRIMWQAIEARAKGTVQFDLQDSRALTYEPGAFDAVFSMSVLEHVEGEEKDAAALGEMLRVLRPDGLIVLSVPIGQTHQNQLRPLRGVDHQGAPGNDDEFFQRVYSRESVAVSLLNPLSVQAINENCVTIARKPTAFLKEYLKLGQSLRGFLGFINPLMSTRYNITLTDASARIPSEYGARHSGSDIYGDLICSAVKKS